MAKFGYSTGTFPSKIFLFLENLARRCSTEKKGEKEAAQTITRKIREGGEK